MTAYNNFITDFPNRCSELLSTIYPQVNNSREVTLMLSLAASGLIIPFERLKDSDTPHPSGDKEKYKEAKQKLEELKNISFIDSDFCNKVHSWEHGITSSVTGDLEAWIFEKEVKKISNEKKCYTIIKNIRNALGHGNIFIKGSKIEKVIFLSSLCKDKPEKFDYIQANPEDFKYFIEAWFKFISRLNL